MQVSLPSLIPFFLISGQRIPPRSGLRGLPHFTKTSLTELLRRHRLYHKKIPNENDHLGIFLTTDRKKGDVLGNEIISFSFYDAILRALPVSIPNASSDTVVPNVDSIPMCNAPHVVPAPYSPALGILEFQRVVAREDMIAGTKLILLPCVSAQTN